jgi:hypothetical protein
VSLILSYFVSGAHAPGTEVEPFGFSVNSQSNRVNIRQPVTTGMALGMAHVMTELWYFTTYVALQF